MNIYTGDVRTYDEWYYCGTDGIMKNAVDEGEAVAVIQNKNGDWIEVQHE